MHEKNRFYTNVYTFCVHIQHFDDKKGLLGTALIMFKVPTRMIRCTTGVLISNTSERCVRQRSSSSRRQRSDACICFQTVQSSLCRKLQTPQLQYCCALLQFMLVLRLLSTHSLFKILISFVCSCHTVLLQLVELCPHSL
jgi:hypothetical protein